MDIITYHGQQGRHGKFHVDQLKVLTEPTIVKCVSIDQPNRRLCIPVERNSSVHGPEE
jgi:hypothetical protein